MGKRKDKRQLSQFSGIDTEVLLTKDLEDEVIYSVQKLFIDNYHEANLRYLEECFNRMRCLTLAKDDGIPIGFSLGDSVQINLPRFEEPQSVVLHGLGCIEDKYRKIGLFKHLQKLSSSLGDPIPSGSRRLICGRVAHPVSFKGISLNESVVPKINIVPTKWQQEIGKSIAQLYGVEFDEETFIVRSSAGAIGYPKIKVEASKTDWNIFRNVDRESGESLLAIVWYPDAPKDWYKE